MTFHDLNIRNDFPVLQRTVHGKPLIYLDNAATTQKPQQVIDAMSTYYQQFNANIHRGIHQLAEEATTAYEETRKTIKRFFGFGNDYEVIFTKNTTEALNLVAQRFMTISEMKERTNLVTSIIEHHANFVPWQQTAKTHHYDFRVLPVHDKGFEQYDELIDEQTAVVAVSMLSNVTGEQMNYHDVLSQAKRYHPLTVLDAAQAAPHWLVNGEEIDADFVAFSAHKMLGPTGLGILLAKRKYLEAMEPFLYGGDMIHEVSAEKTTFAEPPWKFEAGTMPIAEVIGFQKALEYLQSIGKQKMLTHAQELTKLFYDLAEEHHMHVISAFENQQKEKMPVFSFHDEHAHPHDIASILDSKGIAIRAGHHCAMPFMKSRNLPGTARASAYLYTTEEEIYTFIEAYDKARRIFW